MGTREVTLPSGAVVLFTETADWIQIAYVTLAPLVGKLAASVLVAVALLPSAQSSTNTATLAGQVVMEGFMHWKLTPWARRLVTRLCAIVPAVIHISLTGGRNVTDLLTLSQVVLAVQLPLAMFPLLLFAGSRKLMGGAASARFSDGCRMGVVALRSPCSISTACPGRCTTP